MSSGRDWDRLLEELRADFDAGFAELRASASTGGSDAVVVITGEHAFALRLAQLGGIARADHIVPVPGIPPPGLGLAASGDRLVPVFDLAAALGCGSGGERLSWMLLADHLGERWGFACGRLVGLAAVGDATHIRTGGHRAEVVDLAACRSRLEPATTEDL